MCGILGCVTKPDSVNIKDFQHSLDTIAHRGPDDQGIYNNENRTVYLGHNRLSIIDLSERGHQPMSSDDGRYWLTFNGEIFNFLEIKKELVEKGYQFKSATDSEMIIYAYAEWGEKCVERFIGQFAFAIWDEEKREMFIARDRIGIKPLFYYFYDDVFIFASEIKALKMFPSVNLDLDNSAIYDYLTYLYVPAPKTCYKNIRKLSAGHQMKYSRGKLEITEYWDVPMGNYSITSESDAIDGILSIIEDSVKIRLMSDVPLGVFLSGGIDSSTIATMAAKVSSEKPKTFAVGFDVDSHNELDDAKAVAEFLDTEHYEKILSLDMADELFNSLVSSFDEPFSDSSAMPTYLVSKSAREKVTVVLSGDGGDEIFGGYKWFKRFMNTKTTSSMSRLVPSGIKKAIIRAGGTGKYLTLKTHLISDDFERYVYLRGGMTNAEKQIYLKPEFLSEFKDYDDMWYYKKYWNCELDMMTRLQYLEIKTFLAEDILRKVDQMSMLNSLEARVPLLDHRLVEFVMTVRPDIRNKGGELKYLLKQSTKGLLPERVLKKKKKGFSIPMSFWAKKLGNSVDSYDTIYSENNRMSLMRNNPSKEYQYKILNLWGAKNSEKS